jgi:hypothetical protein
MERLGVDSVAVAPVAEGAVPRHCGPGGRNVKSLEERVTELELDRKVDHELLKVISRLLAALVSAISRSRCHCQEAVRGSPRGSDEKGQDRT